MSTFIRWLSILLDKITELPGAAGLTVKKPKLGEPLFLLNTFSRKIHSFFLLYVLQLTLDTYQAGGDCRVKRAPSVELTSGLKIRTPTVSGS